MANMLATIFLLICLLTVTFQSQSQDRVLLSSLRFYQPSLVVLFTCWKRHDRIRVHKRIISEGLDVRLVFLDVSLGGGAATAKVNMKEYEKITFFLDASCENSEEILLEASKLDIAGLFQFLYTWHLLTVNVNSIINIFHKIKTRMDMDVKLYQLSKDDIEILEIYNPGINVGLKIRRLGKLKNDKIILEPFESYYESRKNMSGVLIRSANVIKYPFTGTFHEYMVDTQLMKHDIYSKFHYQLFLGLVEIHGFAYNTTLSVSWFGNTSRGEDGGVAKLLWDEDIEISSAGCVIRLLLNDRIDYFDFIMPYYKFRSCFYFRNPGLVKPNFQEVLKPFAKQTWFVALYVTGIICVCIEISYFIHSNRTWSSLVSFRSIFYVIAAFSQQSIDVPTQLASRIIFLHLLICSVLLYNYYTSSLVSSLISTEPEVMKTIKELVESNLKVGLELQPYLITFILDRVKEDPDIDLLNKTKFYERNELNVFSAEEGVRRVHEGEFAYHLESVTAYSLISDSFEQESICDLAEIPLIQSDTSLMTKKKCEYKKLFQISLRKMWQSGIIKKLYKTWVMGKPECLSSTRVISVTVNDLFLPYFLFVLGVLGSIVVLIIEIIWNKCKYQSLHDRNIKIVVPFES